jgi:hypothetical protein
MVPEMPSSGVAADPVDEVVRDRSTMEDPREAEKRALEEEGFDPDACELCWLVNTLR